MIKWESEEVYHRGDDYFRALKHDLSQARFGVDFESYIFEPKTLGHEFAEILIGLSRRGIRVRLLVDGIGSYGFPKKLIQKLLAGGVAVRIYHPVFFASLLRGVGRFISQLNRRDHRKICVIDARIAYVGGINVMDAQSEKLSGKKAWRDTAARVKGVEVLYLMRAFERTFRRAWVPRKSPEDRGIVITARAFLDLLARIRDARRLRMREREPKLVRLNDRRANRRELTRTFAKLLLSARSRIWLTTAYFVPSPGFVRLLRMAAWRGVDVRIVVPGKSDVFFIPWVASAFYDSLLHAGIGIYEYQPRILHSKTTLVDDLAFIGSSNLNQRSLFHDLEAAVLLNHKKSIVEIASQFEKDLEESKTLTLDQGPHRSWIIRLLGRLAMLMRHFL